MPLQDAPKNQRSKFFNFSFKKHIKKSSVGRMLIAIYVLVVLALSATAKANKDTSSLIKFDSKFLIKV